jgi:hypothetical protein
VPLHSLHMLFSAIEIFMGTGLLILLLRAKELRTYWPLLVLAMWQAIPFAVLVYVQRYGPGRIPARHAYAMYYYTYWTVFAAEAICAIILTYTILHGAMAPLQGLQKLVKIVYFLAASISVMVALTVAFTPETKQTQLLQLTVVEFQRATGIVTVSLAIFVCIAIRPMGLSLKSRVFGTSAGLVIVSIMNTFEANYLLQSRPLYGTHSLIQITVSCIAEITWLYYFVVPEPKRKFVLLSTTSPFHRWNQIAEQFGQSPGFVAIGGIPPEAFADAEIEVFHRASAKMNELEGQNNDPALPRQAS